MEIIAISLLICFLMALGCFVLQTHAEVNALRQQNIDLLNRLMANDYKEYAAIELKKPVSHEKPVARSLMDNEDVYPVN